MIADSLVNPHPCGGYMTIVILLGSIRIYTGGDYIGDNGKENRHYRDYIGALYENGSYYTTGII